MDPINWTITGTDDSKKVATPFVHLSGCGRRGSGPCSPCWPSTSPAERNWSKWGLVYTSQLGLEKAEKLVAIKAKLGKQLASGVDELITLDYVEEADEAEAS